MPCDFVSRHVFIVDDLRQDLADFLEISLAELTPKMHRRYYVDACFYDFMARHEHNYVAWLERGEFYLYNSTQWHEMLGLQGLCAIHLRPPVGHPRRCLDFGAGIGTHALIDAALGWDITLCEINRRSRAFARFRFDRHCLEGRLCESLAEDERFDLVRAWDVVGHLVTPHETMRRIVSALAPSGLLQINFDNHADNDWHRNQDLSFPQLLSDLGLEPLSEQLWCRRRANVMPLEPVITYANGHA